MRSDMYDEAVYSFVCHQHLKYLHLDTCSGTILFQYQSHNINSNKKKMT